MARSVNKVTLIGNLGNDPEMKALPSGSQVANLSIATTDSWRDRNSGEMQERTEWHRVVCFDRLAEICGLPEIQSHDQHRTQEWLFHPDLRQQTRYWQLELNKKMNI